MDDNPQLPQSDELPSPQSFAVMTALFEGGLAVAAVALGWLLGQDPLASFPKTWPQAAAGLAWGAAAAAPPLLLLMVCLRWPPRWFARLAKVVDELMVPLFSPLRVVELAVISILAGLGEELLFRGIVQQTLADWIPAPAGVWVAWALAGLLFGLLHHITPGYAALAALIGLYLGGLWLWTGNLLAPIAAHALYDLLVMLYLVKIRGPRLGNRAAGE